MVARQEVWRSTTVLPFLTSVLALTVILSDAAATDTKGLEGVEWRLVVMAGAQTSPAAGNRQPSILFDPTQKKASGFAGCNNFFGSYAREGSSLTLGPLGSTRKACPEQEMDLEGKYLRVLKRTRGWRITDSALLLVAGDEVLARFTTGTNAGAAVDPGSTTYRLRSMPSGTATLSRGEFRGPAAPGSASEIVVKLTDSQAFGFLQGKEAGAVVLASSLGGTGTFYELALLFRDAQGWENRDTVLLGDRVKVQSVKIENDHVVVRMKTQGPRDPICCPTAEVARRFAVRDYRLVPAIEGNAGGEPDITGTVWQWTKTIYNNDEKVMPSKPENYTVRFLPNGSIEVKADCNLKGGTYSLDGGKLSVQINRSTMAACEPGSLEDAFVRDLSRGAVLFLKDGNLYLDLRYDTGTMQLVPRKMR